MECGVFDQLTLSDTRHSISKRAAIEGISTKGISGCRQPADQGSGNISVLLGNGNGTFEAKTDYAAGALARTIDHR
jgi:hypothetical protein